MTVNWRPQTDSEQARAWRTDVLQDLEVLHATYRSHTFPRHLHEEFCIGVVTQGAEKVGYRGSTYLAPAGSLVVIPPEAVHSNIAADETGWSFQVCYPSPALFAQLGVGQSIPHFTQPIIADRPLARVFIRFHQLLSQANPQNTPRQILEAESVLLSALAILVKRYSKPGLPDGRSCQHESGAVGQIKDYLHTHYAEKITLQDLAELTELSPYYLSRVFQKATGLPPHAYLIQVRIIQAKVLLSKHASIAQVAIDLGFTDQSHFTKTFKTLVGVTPKQYQNNR
ncbi:MAG: AraC family transcriptional regulator [Cyanobacteria bacterium P01_A01_bin.114]